MRFGLSRASRSQELSYANKLTGWMRHQDASVASMMLLLNLDTVQERIQTDAVGEKSKQYAIAEPGAFQRDSRNVIRLTEVHTAPQICMLTE
jgi:hypothetical protein